MFRHDLEHTGRYYYNFPETPSLMWKFQTTDYVDSSPAIGADDVIYIESGKYLFSISPDGFFKWEFDLEVAISTSPSIGEHGVILVGASNIFHYGLGALKPGIFDFISNIKTVSFNVKLDV